jgi:hypothetical protein
MPDLGTLLEREMDEIRPAGYTIVDVARRRERRSRNRRIGTAVVAFAIAGAAIVGVLEAFVLAPSRTPASGNQSPSPSSTSSSVRVLAPSDCPDFSCEGPLEPGGQYRATYYDTTIAFEIFSPGWMWSYTGNFVIGPTSPTPPGSDGIYVGPTVPTPGSDGIYFLTDPAIASQNCKDSAQRGVGRSVDDLVAWIEAAPGLAVSEPTQVRIGGLDGVQLDLQLDPAWKKTCFYSDGQPVHPLVFSGADIGGYNWPIGPGQSMRWYILDSDQGVIIVDIEDNPGGLSHDDLLQTGIGIVDSMTFSPTS